MNGGNGEPMFVICNACQRPVENATRASDGEFYHRDCNPNTPPRFGGARPALGAQ